MADRESGVAGVLLVIAAAVLLATTTAALAWVGAVAARQRAESVADLAALAAAGDLQTGGEGCNRAAELVAASSEPVRLVGCVVEGTTAAVVVEAPLPVLTRMVAGMDMPPARARARAGGT